ncbi:toxin glutamine deamidase domain-containing protein [Amycolatopsis japonica]|uniref:toxin glutamine deamidase domain-containing protein n=1 Tax=Amycolatopsis japonica TaxID=208439 RepID=UPI0036721AE7
MADGDVQEPNCDLWDAVLKLLPAIVEWPPDSETLAEHHATQWDKAAVEFEDSVKIVDAAANRIHQPGGGGTWPDAAGGFMQGVIKRRNGSEGAQQVAGALKGMAGEYRFYSQILKSAKTSIKGYVEDLSWQYTALGFNIPKYAKKNQADFALNVAAEVIEIMMMHAGWIEDPSTIPQPENPDNNILTGLWDSAVDQFKALAGLAGFDENFNWSPFNAQVAWGHMDKLLLSLAVYSMPYGLGYVVDEQVFDGVLGKTLTEAGKAFVDYENWDKDSWGHALGYTTGMVAGLIGPTRGAGAAVRLAGKTFKAPRVLKLGENIGKFTLTHGALKVIDKIENSPKLKAALKDGDFVLPSSVTPEVARLIHDRPGEPPAAGAHGPGGGGPHGPEPTKPPSSQAPHPETRPEPNLPHDRTPPPNTPARENPSPAVGSGERLLDESPRPEPRPAHGDQTPVTKGDGVENLKREPGSSAAEPPPARHDPSSGPPEQRPTHPSEVTPSSSAEHAPATRTEGQPSGSGHGAEGAATRSADTPASALGRDVPTAVTPMHTSAGDSAPTASKRTDTGGTDRATPPRPSAEEVRRLQDKAKVAHMERKFYEEAQRQAGGAVYPDHVVKAWSRHAAHSEPIRLENGKPGEAVGRTSTGPRSTELSHNRGAHSGAETGHPSSGDKSPGKAEEHGRQNSPEPDKAKRGAPGDAADRPRTAPRTTGLSHNRGAHSGVETGHPNGGGDKSPARTQDHGPRDTPEPDQPKPDNTRKPPRRLSLDEFVKEHYPEEYRKAHGDGDGPEGLGGGGADRPPPEPRPSGAGGARQVEAAQGSVALKTHPEVAEPVAEKAPAPDRAPTAAKAVIEAPARETARPEPQTAKPIPQKPLILRPEDTPEPLHPDTVTPLPPLEIQPSSPARVIPGWAEPPRFGDPERPWFGDPERPWFGDPEPPRFGDPEPPRFGDPERPWFGDPEPPKRPDRAGDPVLPGLPRTSEPTTQPPEDPPAVRPEIPELPKEPEIRELPKDPEVPVRHEGSRIPSLPTDPEIRELPRGLEYPEPPREPELPADPLQVAQQKPPPSVGQADKWFDPKWHTPWPEPGGLQEFIDGAIERSALKAEAAAAWEEWNAASESAAREHPREAHLDNVAFGVATDKEPTPEDWAKVAAMDDYAPELPGIRAKLDAIRESDPGHYRDLTTLLSDPEYSFDKKLWLANVFLMPAGAASPSKLPARVESAAPAVRDRLERSLAQGMLSPKEFQQRMEAWAAFVTKAAGLRESIDEANRNDDVRPVLEELRAFSESLREYARAHADSPVPAWREVVRFDLLDPHRLRTLQPSVKDGQFDVVTQAIVAHWFESIFGAAGLDYATRAAALAVPLDKAALEQRFPGLDIDDVFGDLLRIDSNRDGVFMPDSGTGFIRPQLGMAEFITTMMHEFAVHGLQDPASVALGDRAAQAWADILFRVAHEFQGRSGEILVTEAMRAEAEKSIVPPELRRDVSDLPRLSPMARDLDQLNRVIQIEFGGLPAAYKAALFHQLMAMGVSHERDLARIRGAVAAGGPKIRNPVVEAFEADPRGFATRYPRPEPPEAPEPPAPSPGPTGRPTPPGPGMPPAASSQPDSRTDPSGPVTLGEPPRRRPDVPARQPESGVRPTSSAPSPIPPPGIPVAVWRELSGAERVALTDIHSRGLNAAGTLAATVAQLRGKKKPPPLRKLPKLLGKMPEQQRAEFEARLKGYTAEGQTAAPATGYLDRTGSLGGPATLTSADHENLARVAVLDRQLSRAVANPWLRRRLQDEMAGLLDALGLNPNQPGFVHRAAALEDHPVAPVVWRRLGPLDDPLGLPTTAKNLATQLSGTIIPGTVPSAVFVAMGSVHAGIAYALTTFLAAVTAGFLTRRHEAGDDAAISDRRKELDAQRQFEQVVLPTDRLRLLLSRLGLPAWHGPDLAAVKPPGESKASGVQSLRNFYLRYGVPPSTAVAVSMLPVLELATSTRLGLAIGGVVAAVVTPLLQWKRARAKVNTELRGGERNAVELRKEAKRALDKADRAREYAASGRPVPETDGHDPGTPPARSSLPMSATLTEAVDGPVQVGRRAVPPSEPKPLDPDAVIKMTLQEAMLDYGGAKLLLGLPAIPLVSRIDKIEMVNKIARSAVDKKAKFEAEQAKDRALQDRHVAAVAAARTAAVDAAAQRPGVLQRLRDLFGTRPGQAAPVAVPAHQAETTPLPSPIPVERPGSATKSDYKDTHRVLAVLGGFGSAAVALAFGLDLAYAVAALTAVTAGGWAGRDKWRHRQVELAARNKKADADAVRSFADYEHDAAALADFLTDRLTEPFLSVAAEAAQAGRPDVLGLLTTVWETLARNTEAEPGAQPEATPFDELGPPRNEGERWRSQAVQDRSRAELEEIHHSAKAEQAALAVRWGDWSTLGARLGLLVTTLELVDRALAQLDNVGQDGTGPVQATVAGLSKALHDYQQTGARYLEPPAEVQKAREDLSKVDDAAARYLDRSALSWRRPRTSDVRAALDAVDEAVRDYRRSAVPADHASGAEAAVHKAIDRYQDLRNPARHEPSATVTRAAVTEVRNAIARHREETAAGWRLPDSATDEVRDALTGLKHAINRYQQFSAPFGKGPRAESVGAALTEIERIIDRYRRASAPKWAEPAGQDVKLGQVLGELHWALHHYWQVSAPRGRASTGYDKAMKAVEKDLKKALYAVKKLKVPGMNAKPAEVAPSSPGRALSGGVDVHYAPAGMAVGPATETLKAHLRTMLANRPDPAQPYVVTLHDDGSLPSPEELAAATQRGEYYTPGRPVRLHSCGSAAWARRFAIALGAPVVAPVADLHILGRHTELPDGTVLPFGQEVVEGYPVGGGWVEYPPNGKSPIMLREAAGARPITLDELTAANPVVLGPDGDFSKLFRTTPLNELTALHAGTARLRPAEVKAYLERFHPQLDKVNPGYHDEDAVSAGYTTNCTRAVVYHERRRLGEDVTAPPVRPEYDQTMGSLQYVSDRLGGEWDRSHGTGYDSVISAMLDRPVGSLAVIAVESENRLGANTKHVALVSRDKHGIVFLDPLDGALMKLPAKPTTIALLPYTDAGGPPGNLRLPEPARDRLLDEKIVTTASDGSAEYRTLPELSSDVGYNGRHETEARHPAYLRYPPSPDSGPADSTALFGTTSLHSLPAMDADTVDGRWKEAVAFILEHFPQLPETNPGYYEDWADRLGFHTNCTRCVVHYVLRTLGEDVTAPPVPVELKDEMATLGYVSENLGGTWTEIYDASYDSVISAMSARPVGALAAVNFLYEKDNRKIGSHVALVANHPDGVVFLDPLTGWLSLLEERPLQIMLLPFPENRGV